MLDLCFCVLNWIKIRDIYTLLPRFVHSLREVDTDNPSRATNVKPASHEADGNNTNFTKFWTPTTNNHQSLSQ
jgi:hypothetical protein